MVGINIVRLRFRIAKLLLPAVQHTKETDDVLKYLTRVLLAERPTETRLPNTDGVLNEIGARIRSADSWRFALGGLPSLYRRI